MPSASASRAKTSHPFAQQMHEIAAVSTASVEYAHAGCDIASQNLIEYVDVDLAELFLDIHGDCVLSVRA